MAENAIQEGDVVFIHYTLTGNEGQVIDSSQGRPPLGYLHGYRNIVAGLERALTGRAVGDRFDVAIPPEEGYGLREGPEPQPVPRSEFGKDARHLQVGMSFHATTSDGQNLTLWITDIQGDEVFVDANHPLAGQTLNFAIEVAEVRAATTEELTHGHVHGPGGHHH